jgi:branched-chain amino acid transport system substrate-binding protein
VLKKAALLFSVSMGVFLTACAGGGAAAGDDDVVRVGWIGPLTGDMAVWGTSELASTRMFFDQLNEEGGLLGRQVEVISYDTRGDLVEAVNVTRRLATLHNVIGIIGPNTSGQAIAMSPALEETETPGIATVATNPLVTNTADGDVLPFNFRVAFVDTYQGAVVAGFAYNHLNARTAAVLFDVGSDYSQGVSEFFQAHFTSLGGEIVAVEGFNPMDVDFRPQLTSINNVSPDVLLMPFSFREVAMATEQARSLGLDTTFLGTDTWPSALLLEMTADSGSIEGSYLVHHLDTNDPAVAWLFNMYNETTGREPEINAFLAWDASTMLVEAVERADSFDRIEIRDALIGTNFVGVTGPIIICPTTHSPDGKQAAILTVRNNEFVFVQNYSPTFR